MLRWSGYSECIKVSHRQGPLQRDGWPREALQLEHWKRGQTVFRELLEDFHLLANAHAGHT